MITSTTLTVNAGCRILGINGHELMNSGSIKFVQRAKASELYSQGEYFKPRLALKWTQA